MKASIMSMTKKVINGFVRNGEILAYPVGELSTMDLSDEQMRYLRSFVALLMGSSLLNRYSWAYIKAPVNSVRNAMRYWNARHPDAPINEKTGVNAVDRNRLLLQGIFGDALDMVLFRPDRADMERYWSELIRAMEKYGKDSMFVEQVSIPVSKAVSPEEPDISDVEAFANAIAPYRVSATNEAADFLRIYHNVAEYFNYLHRKADKTEREHRWYTAMKEFIEGRMEELDCGLLNLE